MSYYANGSGDIELSAWNKEIETILDEQFEYDPYDLVHTKVAVWADGSYCEVGLAESLAKLNPYTINGSIRYYGEDGSIWEWFYDQHTGQWEEGSAGIKWPSECNISIGVEDLPNRQRQVELAIAKSILTIFKAHYIDTDCQDAEKAAETYKDLIAGIIQNEAWLQAYIKGDDETWFNPIKESNIEYAVEMAVFTWVRNHFE